MWRGWNLRIKIVVLTMAVVLPIMAAATALTVRMSFAQDRGIEFACRACSVRVEDRHKIAAYTGGLRKDLPRCVACRSKLLTPARILRVLTEAEDRFQAQAQQPHAAGGRNATRVVRPTTVRG